MRAQELFERENPGRLWRAPSGTTPGSIVDRSAAGLLERQNYLSRVRTKMRAEGVQIEKDEENLTQLSLGA
ncbi:hypothetical protein [Methylobacterium goesingense]|uniref:Uncharacterized protein n=1 Tax=Methylobacterium goesingense TaxID=243690 RepID=A0ABV2L1E6_9HYPH|nr:hypothetical protein [Methylobacterium goesingense]